MPAPVGIELDATVVRVLASGPGWARALPRVPSGHLVTVSASSDVLAGDRAEAEQRGYRFAGVVRPGLLPDDVDAVHVLVSHALAEAEPRWWRQLTGGADRVLPLAFGPVLRLLRDVVALHLGGLHPLVGR